MSLQVSAVSGMKHVAAFHFVDLDTDDETYAGVRAAPGKVAVTISLMKDGDIELFLPTADAERLLEALREACRVAEGPPR